MTQNLYTPLLERPLVFASKSIPLSIIKEVEQFVIRNCLIKVSQEHSLSPMQRCCPHCLKAFVLQIAQEQGINEKVQKELLRKLPGSIGHNGYYVDGEELIAVEKSFSY
jgi:hypothetical protein